MAVFNLLKQTVSDFMEDHGTRLAAALSYYTVFSLPPLLILIMLMLSAVMDPQDVQRLLEGEVGGLLGPAGSDQIREVLQNAEAPDFSRGAAALVGLGALLFGAVGAFVELQNALNRVWEVQPDPEAGGIKRFIGQRVLSFGMLLTIVFLLLVSLVVSAALTAFGEQLAAFLPGMMSGAVLLAINAVISLGVITLLFTLLFHNVPDAEIRWKDAAVGGAATAVLFVIGKFVLGMYLGRSDPGSAFGAAGALAMLLVWIYYSAVILFLGAEFTQAWTIHRGEGIRPSDGAVRMVEKREVVKDDERAHVQRTRQETPRQTRLDLPGAGG